MSVGVQGEDEDAFIDDRVAAESVDFGLAASQAAQGCAPTSRLCSSAGNEYRPTSTGQIPLANHAADNLVE